jgi:hypothetical protein
MLEHWIIDKNRNEKKESVAPLLLHGCGRQGTPMPSFYEFSKSQSGIQARESEEEIWGIDSNRVTG